MKKITLFPGTDKNGVPENFAPLSFEMGHVYSIVGPTGSGKTQLLEDIESFCAGDGITKRCLKGAKDKPFPKMASLSQNMHFILDLTTGEFLKRRCLSEPMAKKALCLANDLCGEKISPQDILTRLSGGQSRALMIADVALNSNASVILIDEIENAGIDKIAAMDLLLHHEKLVLVITHDPLLSLYGEKRLIMKNGGINGILVRSEEEKRLLKTLGNIHTFQEEIRRDLRRGLSLKERSLNLGYAILE